VLGLVPELGVGWWLESPLAPFLSSPLLLCFEPATEDADGALSVPR
jgi:hypothetical protein